MPNKKGSKIAASRARAQTAAKKKARGTGTTLPAAAFVKPEDTLVVQDELDEMLEEAADGGADAEQELQESAAVAVAPAAKQRVAAASRRTPRIAASRRLRQHEDALPMQGLGREIGTIGVITATIAIALVVLKFATDIGA
jgi:hypothetical protein